MERAFGGNSKGPQLAVLQALAIVEAAPDYEGAVPEALVRVVGAKILNALAEAHQLKEGDMSRVALAVSAPHPGQHFPCSAVRMKSRTGHRNTSGAHRNRAGGCHPKPRSGCATRCSASSRSTNQRQAPLRPRLSPRMPTARPAPPQKLTKTSTS
jgi:hypothetical protein